MTQTTYQKTQLNSNQDRNNTLALIVAMRIDELISALDIKLYKAGNKLIGNCPIHGGKKHQSFNLYPEGETVPGYWKCRSHHCEDVFHPTVIGFTRGVLSHNQFNWEKKGDKTISFFDTLQWLAKFVNQDLDKIEIDQAEMERRRFAAQVYNLTKNIKHENGVSRKVVKDNLIIPAEYYIKRGYSPDILIKYDVGFCNKQGKEMFNRVVVPVYDDSKNNMIGCAARSVYPQCKECECYHAVNSPCPQEDKKYLFSKWRNNENFNTGSCLYNYWNAKKFIKESGVVILVEGPGDVWRLEECGIHNSVALFGCELTDEQQVLLESSGAMSVIILLDNDKAGKEAMDKMKSILNRSYNIYTPKIINKDVGDTPCEQVKKEILPIIQEIQLKNQTYVF